MHSLLKYRPQAKATKIKLGEMTLGRQRAEPALFHLNRVIFWNSLSILNYDANPLPFPTPMQCRSMQLVAYALEPSNKSILEYHALTASYLPSVLMFCPRPSAHSPSSIHPTTVAGQQVARTQIGAGSPISVMSMSLLRKLSLNPILDTPGQVSVREEVTLGSHTEKVFIQVLPDHVLNSFDLILSQDWSAIAADQDTLKRSSSGMFKIAAPCSCSSPRVA